MRRLSIAFNFLQYNLFYNMKKEKIFFYILSFVLLNDNFLYATENNNIQQTEKQVNKEESGRFKDTFKTFIKSYIFIRFY